MRHLVPGTSWTGCVPRSTNPVIQLAVTLETSFSLYILSSKIKVYVLFGGGGGEGVVVHEKIW